MSSVDVRAAMSVSCWRDISSRKAQGVESVLKGGNSVCPIALDFGHFPRNEIPGKRQPDEGFIAAV
jgi:hypothetical protein